jgi:hypothetical protein
MLEITLIVALALLLVLMILAVPWRLLRIDRLKSAVLFSTLSVLLFTPVLVGLGVGAIVVPIGLLYFSPDTIAGHWSLWTVDPVLWLGYPTLTAAIAFAVSYELLPPRPRPGTPSYPSLWTLTKRIPSRTRVTIAAVGLSVATVSAAVFWFFYGEGITEQGAYRVAVDDLRKYADRCRLDLGRYLPPSPGDMSGLSLYEFVWVPTVPGDPQLRVIVEPRRVEVLIREEPSRGLGACG